MSELAQSNFLWHNLDESSIFHIPDRKSEECLIILTRNSVKEKEIMSFSEYNFGFLVNVFLIILNYKFSNFQNLPKIKSNFP